MIVEVIGFVILTFIFVIYIEHDIGNIVFRQDSLGKIVFTFHGLLSYLMNPLTNTFLWNWDMLKYNYMVWIIMYNISIHARELIYKTTTDSDDTATTVL